ncbi:MAG: glutathione S-transferase family protein, partial [Steroidobacteraceae bacterium]
RLVNFETGEHKAPDFLQVNPMGKLPAIVHRDVAITETAAICTYLADAFPAAGLAPALDDPHRGAYLRWLFFGAGCIEPATTDHMLSREPGRKTMMGYGSYDDVVGVLQNALAQGPNLLGERFTGADVYVGSQIGWALMMKGLPALPEFQAYVARNMQRPAAKRAFEQAEHLTAKLKAG